MNTRISFKGFTMVELMIVVAIIGVLGVIVLPNMMTARTKARRNACLNNLRMIQNAKDQLALQQVMNESTVPTAAQLIPYLKDGILPKEPISWLTSDYTAGINAISSKPTCPNSTAALGNHDLSYAGT